MVTPYNESKIIFKDVFVSKKGLLVIPILLTLFSFTQNSYASATASYVGTVADENEVIYTTPSYPLIIDACTDLANFIFIDAGYSNIISISPSNDSCNIIFENSFGDLWLHDSTGLNRITPPPSGRPRQKAIYQGTDDFDEEKNLGECGPQAGNPITISTGNKFQTETDYTGSSPFSLSFKRFYNSNSSVRSENIGLHWRHNYNLSIESIDADTVDVYRDDGKVFTFEFDGSNWTSDADVILSLIDTGSGWELTTANDSIEAYDTNGQLVSITSREGFTQTFTHDLSSANGGDDNPDTLDKVTGHFNREMVFTYDNNDRISTMTDPAGEVYTYSYDVNDNLTSISYPDETPGNTTDNPTRVYHYEDTNFIHALTGITDENGNSFATYGYDSEGRAIFSEHSGGINRIDIVYNPDGTATMTDSLGSVQTYHFEAHHGVLKTSYIDGDQCNVCGGQFEDTAYDANGFIASRTDFNGNLTTFINNTRGLQTSRTEAVGTTEERTTTTEWHADFRLPTKITEPGKETTFTYDTVGRLLTHTETDTVSLDTRTTTMTYNVDGLLASIDGPRIDVSDVTNFDYDVLGNLIKTTNALGHETEITSHDTHGRPLTIEDPNNTLTTLTYDARSRLLTRTVDSQTTSFNYDAVGNITKTTLPNGAFLENEYDTAQRLIAVEDNLGNRIEYTLDSVGNRTQEDVKDPLSVLTRTQSRVYNTLNQLIESIGGAGQITTFAYDTNGNQTNMTIDPTGLNQTTVQAFDALNRLTSITNADNGLTQLAYDARDNLISVTDPTGLVTIYTYDGLDNLTQQDSPDTGITQLTYDDAGNRLTQTDARGVVTDFSYDALNRLTDIDYADNSQDVFFTYDTCTNGIGRLCQMDDASGTTVYAYDARGNLTLKSSGNIFTPYQTINYVYNGADQIVQTIYPSGRIVDQVRNVLGQIEAITTTVDSVTTTLADNLTYAPFGPMTAMDYGNGITQDRSYDLDYRLTALTTMNGSVYQDLDYSFDAANNITQITNIVDSTRSQTLGYDVLNRLTDATGIYGDKDFTYDPNGNRLSDDIDSSQLTTYSYAVDSHHMLQAGQNNYIYDDVGNNLSGKQHLGGEFSFAYAANNRLGSAVFPGWYFGTAGIYTYNGIGERVWKTAWEVLLYRYFYDDGKLITDTEIGGLSDKEYIYLEDMPLAMLENGHIYYYHNDHLNTPQLMTDESQTVVWEADYDPFGQANITTGTVWNPLRFPGQYFDEETGLHYNYFRYYDPSIGRYITSDPIGIDGGLNTYGYVSQNPIVFIDPFGLLNFFAEGFAGASGPTGLEVSAGPVVTLFDPNNGNTFNLTSFVSGELVAGFDAGAGFNVGLIRGGLSDFSGVFDNISITAFDVVLTLKVTEGTQFGDISFDNIQGFSLGLSPAGLPFGATVSREGTIVADFNLKELLNNLNVNNVCN